MELLECKILVFLVALTFVFCNLFSSMPLALVLGGDESLFVKNKEE